MAKTAGIRKLNASELITFFRQMSYTLHAGISPAEGLAIMAEGFAFGQSDQIPVLLRKNLEECGSFCQALKDSGLFPSYAIHMLQIGEYAGCLDETTASLAAYYDRERSIRQSLKSAVTYPFVMIVIMIAVSGILVVKVLPVFRDVYRQLGSELSGIGLYLAALGNGISRFGFPIILLLILLCCVYAYLISQGRAALPFSRKLYQEISAARFAYSLSLLIHSGMSTDECLNTALELTDYEPLRQKILKCLRQCSEGMDFIQALKEANIFTFMESHMISVGFRSGVPDIVLRQLSDTYQQRADERLGRMIAILEPALVGILSVIVGFILLSVMLPLIGVLSGINTY